MKRQELFDVFQTICRSNHAVSSWSIPVTVGEDNGALNPVQIAEKLVSEGEITEDTLFGVSFKDESEGYYPLDDIEMNGNPITF